MGGVGGTAGGAGTSGTGGGGGSAGGGGGPAGCTDQTKNGTETDVDCGGGVCPACVAGLKCVTATDCASEICDLWGTTTHGTCVPTGSIVYVDSSNDPGQSACSDAAKDGSQAHPYCRIAPALALVGLSPAKTYVHLAGSGNPYDPFVVTSTSSTLTFVGPGKSATRAATIQAAAGANAINIDPVSPSSASVVISGIRALGNGNASVLSCSGLGGSTPQLTIADSSFSGGSNAVSINQCVATVRESALSNASQTGLVLGASSSYSIQNCFIFGNATGVSFQGGTGAFNFNTVAYNTGTSGVACSGTTNHSLEASIVFGNRQVAGSQFTGTTCTLVNVVTGPDSHAAAMQLSPVLISTSDLHLDTTSGAARASNAACCIDRISAPPPSPLPAIDIDYEQRPKGVSWDIGADEAL
jgi:hypothetical protein